MAHASLYMKLHNEYQLIRRDPAAPDIVLTLEFLFTTIDLNGFVQQCRFNRVKVNPNLLVDTAFFLLDADEQGLKYPDGNLASRK